MRATKAPADFRDKRELFQYIRNAGLKVDESMLEEFQKQGLMRPPLRASCGRYGNPGYWSPQQAELLLSLCLATQHKGATTVVSRCLLPIWVWVYWGDDHGITLEQVQHVMQTWAQRMRRGLSRDQARQLATNLIIQVGNAPKGGIQRAHRELTELLSQPYPDPEDLLESLSHVFDPGKRPNGPYALSIVPEAITAYLQALFHGIHILAKGQSLAPGLWFWARHTLLQQLAEYNQQQPSYQQEIQGTPIAPLYATETLVTLHQTVCSDLAMMLGMALLFPSPPHLPAQLRHESWEKQVTSAHMSATITFSPLWLPEKKTLLRGLDIEETITFS